MTQSKESNKCSEHFKRSYQNLIDGSNLPIINLMILVAKLWTRMQLRLDIFSKSSENFLDMINYSDDKPIEDRIKS